MPKYYLHEDGDSPAISLMKLTWEHACKAYPHSWNRFNGAMREAMELAVKRGFTFNEDDIKWVCDNLRPGYWFSADGSYIHACEVGNASAWKSIENYLGRKPFIIDGRRLCVRSRFVWNGERVTVTSFADDQSHVVACSYHRVMEKHYCNDHEYETDGGVKHIYKITHADIKAWNKERREAEKAAAVEQEQPQ